MVLTVSGFVLDVDTAFDKAREWSRRGWLKRVYVQVEHWPHAENNRAAFENWKAALNPLGCSVYATLWGTDFDDIPDRLASYRLELGPQGWLLNFEKPNAEGINMKTIMQAAKLEPVVISYNGLAEQGGFDFRRYASINAEVHGQAYDPDGDSTKGPTPAQVVSSAFFPRICWQAGTGSAWWYRVKLSGTTWYWARLTGSGTLVSSTGKTLGFPDLDVFPDGHREFSAGRYIRSAPLQKTAIGTVAGFAPYHRLGYSLGTTRPITPERLSELAGLAYVNAHPLVRKVDLYTIENTTDEQIRAIAGVA